MRPKTPPARSALLQNKMIHRHGKRGRLTDLYASLLDMKWRYLLTLFALAYLAINAGFATLYVALGNSIKEGKSWTDAFHFSVQTLATIGYGGMTPQGIWGDLIVAFESWFGILTVAFLTGVVFAKFARPSTRILFSRNAVIYKHNGSPCFVFRLINQRGSNVLEAKISATLLLEETTPEGDSIRKLHDLKLQRNFHPLLQMSWQVIHEINKDSPLYGMHPNTSQHRFFRVIVSMSGVDGVLMEKTHACYFYENEHIHWNAKLVGILRSNDNKQLLIDVQHFHDYYKISRVSPLFCELPSSSLQEV